MRTRTTVAALIAAGLLVTLTACGSSDRSVTEPANSGTTKKASGPQSAAKSPSPQLPTQAKIGTTLKFHDPATDDSDETAGSVTVLSYQQPVKSAASAAEESGAKGYVWAALEVKVCSTLGEFTTSSQPWTLAYADGARIEPSSTTYDDFPKPEYVEDAAVGPGDCSRGKIVFPVPGDQRPARAIYATDYMATMRWDLNG
ncbi:hypothetical protein ACFC5Z_23650 [Streptomyces sp. NPDC056004]|uniref:hypothetical protein n=1 Tax=Streptomyces sp. NPDC056004 TaxID=3345677 RepID=UPI0035D5B117